MSDVEDDFGVPPRDSSVRLTDAQQESVLHLQEISGSLNHDAAADILKDCDWDLARAVNRFFGLPDQSQDTSVTRRIHAQTSTLPPVSLVPANQRTLRITESRTSTWWWAFSLLLEPIRLTYHLLFGLARLFVSFLWPDPRTNVTDPVGDVRRFIDHYESAFTQCSLKPADPATLPDTSRGSSLRSPPFFVGSYAEALREAKRTLRFLVVYLHMDSHEDTRKFCHKTLQNEEVIQFLNNSEQLLFWGCNINSPEGYRVSKTLRSHAYPFIGVVGLSNLPAPDSIPYPSTMTGLALLGRIEGAVKPQDLIQQLNSILNDHQDATLSARLDRSEREAAARIREEQDLAYQQSLAQDRAKLAAKEAELRTAAEEASQLAEARRHEEALTMAVSARRLRWRSRLPPAPEAGSPNTVQLSIKMPNGNRVSRVFSITDSVKILYYFILSLEDSPVNFEVQANFPKRLLPCKPEDESDPEDYITEGTIPVAHSTVEDPNTDNYTNPSCRSAGIGTDLMGVVTDWKPSSDKDPPSFEQLGLCKPEILFVIDNDA